jgi:FkbM family methyltransferase
MKKIAGNTKKIIKEIKVDNVSFKVKVERYAEYWDYVNSGIWEPQTFKMIAKYLRPEDTFIDVGTWIGPTTLYAAALCSLVYSFEPDPYSFKELLQNIEMNPELAAKIKPFEEAITANNEEDVILSSYSGGWNTSGSSLLKRSNETKIICKARNLVDFIAKNEIKGKLFIKIDIEGYEKILIPMLLKEKLFSTIKPIIHLSIHSPFFDNAGYELKNLYYLLKEFYKLYDKNGLELEALQEGFTEVVCVPK